MQKSNFPVYAIMALVFLGVTKLIQVTVFDAESYGKVKKGLHKKAKDTKKEKKQTTKDTVSLATELAKTTLSMDSTDSDSLTVASVDDTFDQPVSNNFSNEDSPTLSNNTYESLEELKNLYLAPKLAKLAPGQLREDVIIRYYRHEQDGDGVYALKKLGYYIHERKATETAGLGSNVIYYGEEVATEDIQIVAYVLLAEGLPIKSIEPSSYPWKAHAIEIGTNPNMLDDPVLTEDAIKNFKRQ